MKNLQPGNPVANIDGGSGSVAAAEERLTRAGVALAGRAAGVGLAADVAALYRDGPPRAGAAFRDTVEAGGGTYRKAEVTPGRAMTVFGPVDFPRSRYRPSGTGASPVPSEAVLGLTACGMTPAAAGLSMYPMGGLTARGSCAGAAPRRPPRSGFPGRPETAWRSAPARFWRISVSGRTCPRGPCRRRSRPAGS